MTNKASDLRVFGSASLSEFLGDHVVYRNLVPADPRLAPLAVLGPQLGIPDGWIPRKSEPDYARVMVATLEAAQALRSRSLSIERLVYLGDTRLNDGTAFANLCQAGGWRGRAFIGSQDERPARVEVAPAGPQAGLVLSNRWEGLLAFDDHLTNQGFAVDERTVVVVDLDKTALGARGRNDAVIDLARLEAIQATLVEALGLEFNHQGFQAAYARLNQVAFHAFTADNQDYLAYICLLLGAGLFELEALVADLQSGRMADFGDFISQVQTRRAELPAGLARLHKDILARVRAGDPTPFKAFRRMEYRTTLARMNSLPDEAPVGEILAQEIVITQEVRALTLEWLTRGALLFGLSDKPDEASLPDEDLSHRGFPPLHHARTHAVGASSGAISSLPSPV